MDNGNVAAQAVAKLKKEREKMPAVKQDQLGTLLRGAKAEETKAALMADAVLSLLENFCNQSDKFARAVLGGGSFTDCMKAVAKGTGNYVDGLDAATRAVQFYAKDAKVQPLWSVILPGDSPERSSTGEEKMDKPDCIIDLADFFS